ncbi:MAG: 16S rRNA (cytidine(1402)-2'-O)-methyltransferase [Rickettsiales bacterium]|nr:16S rRNA (cytidine(1402)-2'-O)-methyltransferase [Rickettsiales bacterium]
MELKKALYVVATPIGNMGDITLRALEVLRRCDCIVCEDTRNSLKLLNFYGIKSRNIKVYNDNSDDHRRDSIVSFIQKGNSAAMISDAGTPLISDPGYRLLKSCRDSAVEIIPIPGSSACIAAMSVSCLGSDRFLFVGFLPSSLGQRKQELSELLERKESIICYESPLRLISTLEIIANLDGERVICVARELTKIFEDIKTGKVIEILDYYREKFSLEKARGEIVIIIERTNRPKKLDFNNMDNILKLSLKYLSIKNSAELFSKVFGISKGKVYDRLLFLGKRHEY